MEFYKWRRIGIWEEFEWIIYEREKCACMEIWKEFDEFVNRMFRFTNGKSIVLWGYGLSGLFIHHLFSRANRKIEYIVDDSSLNPKLSIMRSCEIEDITPETCAVILSGEWNEEIEKFLIERGFKENIHYIYARKYLYTGLKNENVWKDISYYEYLENKFGVDIVERKFVDKMENPKKDALNYSPGMGYPLIDVLDNFIFQPEDAVFDFGCGKGGALLLFQRSGISKIAGVEYDKPLYNILLDNFRKVGVSAENIINGDAALIKNELDEYNYFFMYNPFEGKTFRDVIDNIEESWNRKRRHIIFIYSGPYCHRYVVAHRIFRLSKQIYTDYSVRNVNVYTIEE